MAADRNDNDTGQSAPEQGTRLPGPPLYLLWGLFWALMVVIAVRDYFGDHGQHWWQPVLWEGTSAAAATAWLLLQRRIDHRYAIHLDHPLLWFGHHLKWLPLMAVSFVPAVYAARHGVYALLGYTYSHESWGSLFVYESIKLVLFAGLWLGIIFGLDSHAQWQMQRQRLAILQKSLAEAQLSQLRAQLRPHFFFNALNTISALMHIDVARADRLLMRLGDLLRHSLQPTEQELVPLHEEMRLLQLYAQIMLERFADRVTLAWRVGDDTSKGEVPALLLQPLLENAFKHAVERSASRVHVEIEARREAGALVLTIRNTGSTLAPDAREGVGLRNCRERLSVIYGDSAILKLTDTAGTVEARVTLPWREHHA